MRQHQRLGLRPHVKTHKTLAGAALQGGGAPDAARIVVSTLAEAEHFAAGGVHDITYAVPLEPSKFARAWALHASLPSFAVMLDSEEALRALPA